jgi:cell wall-associated NlpC family hydrolase
LFKLRIVAPALAVAVFAIASIQAQPVAASAAPVSEAAGILRFARNQLDKPFRLGAEGLRRYDCSGLVYRTFRENGLARRIGGDKTSRGYYAWAKRHDRITRNPRKGDLVVWGKRGRPVSHIGIFIGYNRRGQAMAVSALTSGVTIHRVGGISVPKRAYIRVHIDR